MTALATRDRLDLLLGSGEGFSPEAIAGILGVDTQSVVTGMTSPVATIDDPELDLSNRISALEGGSLLRGYFDVTHPQYGAVGDGVADDTAAVNAAIAALNAAGGGILWFPTGNYLVGSLTTITVPAIIAGMGRDTGGSVLFLKAGTNASMFTLAAKNVTIEDLGLNGQDSLQTAGTSHGIVTSATVACNYFTFRNLWISHFRNDGLNFNNPGTSLEGHLSNVKSMQNSGRGITINSGCADITPVDCVFSQNKLSGMYVNASGTICVGVHAWGNGTLVGGSDLSGMFMPSGAGGGCRFIGCYFETNGNATNGGDGAQPRGTDNQFVGCTFYANQGRGCYTFSNTGTLYSGCTFRENNRNGAAGANGAGLLFDTCTACVASGCTFRDGQAVKTQTYGYAEAGNNCTDCKFEGNICRAADHLTGSVLVGTGNPVKTIIGAAAATATVHDNRQNGMYSDAANNSATMGAANVAANTAYFRRVTPPRDMTIVKIAVAVATAASASDSIDVGIYDSAGNLLGSSGASTPGVNSTGAKALTLTAPVKLVAGQVYYIALAYGTLGGASAANFAGNSSGFAQQQMFGATVPSVEQFKVAGAPPLASNIGFAGLSVNGACPLFALRES